MNTGCIKILITLWYKGAFIYTLSILYFFLECWKRTHNTPMYVLSLHISQISTYTFHAVRLFVSQFETNNRTAFKKLWVTLIWAYRVSQKEVPPTPWMCLDLVPNENIGRKIVIWFDNISSDTVFIYFFILLVWLSSLHKFKGPLFFRPVHETCFVSNTVLSIWPTCNHNGVS